jgi:hypothetical protein
VKPTACSSGLPSGWSWPVSGWSICGGLDPAKYYELIT